MQDVEQTLPDQDAEAIARMNRWLNTEKVLGEIHQEREAQFDQWGEQDIPMGTGGFGYERLRDVYRDACNRRISAGTVTHADVLLEKVFEAMAEGSHPRLRDELIQAVAVGVKMIELIDKRAAEASSTVAHPGEVIVTEPFPLGVPGEPA